MGTATCRLSVQAEEVVQYEDLQDGDESLLRQPVLLFPDAPLLLRPQCSCSGPQPGDSREGDTALPY